MDTEKEFVYNFYRHGWNTEDQFIGSLKERRIKPERITHFSIMNWAKVLSRKDVLEGRVYFVRLQI